MPTASRADVRVFVAAGRLQPDAAEVELLHGEQADLAGLVGRQEGFGADGVEIAVEILRAARPAPAAALRLDELEPAFDALGLEDGADLVAFEFGMLVIGGSRARTRILSRKPPPTLTSPRRSARICSSPIVTGASPRSSSSPSSPSWCMLGAGPRGHAIVAVEPADRDSEAAALADQGKAGAGASSARSRCSGILPSRLASSSASAASSA